MLFLQVNRKVREMDKARVLNVAKKVSVLELEIQLIEKMKIVSFFTVFKIKSFSLNLIYFGLKNLI